ncbi:sensor histidine kinase [Aestuariispira ectoiniformans]|uniref:sensor histidine kinase n=1 Tax=Aestuariispira ectoiniformans TaxID=2775080 RepID=UPI00223BBA5C|nr:PAS domain-containing sensor histidine kinase [Aestuariispira ectoiniformans]
MTGLEIILAVVVAVLVLAVALGAWRFRRLSGRYAERYAEAPVGVVWTEKGKLHATDLALEFLQVEELPDLAALTAALADDHATIFDNALEALRLDGTSFSLTLDTREAHSTVNLEGRRSGDEIIIWTDDATTTAWLTESYAKAEQETNFFREFLDLLPVPVWWREPRELTLIGCNKAYAAAMEQSREEILGGAKELGAGHIGQRGRALARRALKVSEPVSESHYVVVGGKRRLLDFSEAVVGPVGARIGGFALDRTDLEEGQALLAAHVAAHDQVLENLGTAIIVFGADKRLKFYNQAYLRLWGLESDALSGDPGFGEIMELLRSRRKIPEIVDFPAYKQEQELKFVRLLEPEEELMHLPDERTVRVVTAPHPLGGLMMMLEDVTDRLALERSYNTQIAIQQTTLNNLFEGVAVWGSDGRLRIWNKPFQEMWGFEEVFLKREPHIGEMLDYTRTQWFHRVPDDQWQIQRQTLIVNFTEPKRMNRQIDRIDGRSIDVAHVPLPDGQCLVLYSDVTDTVRVERALAERNAAFEKADLLKAQFISNVSYELRTPLNAIQGFASILSSEYYGSLNDRQAAHVQHILDAADTLMELINDILDLATIQAGFIDLDLGELPLDKLVTQAMEAVRLHAETQHLTIEVKGEVPEQVLHCDAARLVRALSNILDTMISFSPRDHISISVADYTDKVHVIFAGRYGEDEEEDRELLSRRFSGNDPHALRTGAGLSLALAKSFVDLHKGQVLLDTDHGDGFAIICELPRHSLGPVKLAVAGASAQD